MTLKWIEILPMLRQNLHRELFIYGRQYGYLIAVFSVYAVL